MGPLSPIGRGLVAVLPVVVFLIIGILTLHAIVPGHLERRFSEPVLQAVMDMDGGEEPEELRMTLLPSAFQGKGFPVIADMRDGPPAKSSGLFDAACFHPINGPPKKLICFV